MKAKIAIAVVLVLLVIGGLAGVKVIQIKTLIAAAPLMAPPPETVSTTVAREDKWPSSLEAIGTITAVQGVTVTPEVPGAVREVAFESGASVAKGALLVRLDTSTEEAQLRAMEAQTELAKVTLTRVRKLRAENTVPPSELDSAEAAFKQNQANVEALRSTIEKKTIRAPFAGRLGIRLINLGQYLDTGKPIVSLQSLQPVYVEFSLPQQDLARLSLGMNVRLTTDAYPGQEYEGKLTAINPDLDAATRNVRLQATLNNPDEKLRPGMFARVSVRLPEERTLLVIPATAVLSQPFGDLVYVVESKAAKAGASPELTVRQQLVRTGRTRGDFVSVEAGLKAGERIVSAGLFKLRNNMVVVENSTIAPKTSETPRPTDS
jgi:membrane fusion protein, multidrug efflux system